MFDSELFNFPFQANVWGTLSDWMMVIVTGFTLYYLVKTFRSQQTVQSMQLKVTNIENERYRLENMPLFKVETIAGEVNTRYEIVTQKLTLRITLLNSDVKQCKASVKSKNSDIIPDDDNLILANNVSKNSINEINYYLKQPSHIYETDGFEVLLIMDFIDPVDNHYHQNFNVNLQNGRVKLSSDETPTYIY